MCELCLVWPRYQQKVNDTNCCDTVAEVFCKNRTIQMLHNGSQRTHVVKVHMKYPSAISEISCGLREPLCNICIVLFLQNTSATVSQQFVSFTFCWYRGRTKHNSHICWFPHFLLIWDNFADRLEKREIYFWYFRQKLEPSLKKVRNEAPEGLEMTQVRVLETSDIKARYCESSFTFEIWPPPNINKLVQHIIYQSVI